MANRTWTFPIDLRRRTVRLEHQYLGGRRRIYLDDQLIVEDRHLVDWGSHHPFSIEGRPVDVIVATNGATFEYFLLLDGLPIPSAEDQRAGRTQADLLRSKHLKDQAFWSDLSKALDLPYRPQPGVAVAQRHRLAGALRGFDLVFQPAALANNPLTWIVFIHHAAPLSEQTGEQMQADSRMAELIGRQQGNPHYFSHYPGYTWVRLPGIKNESAAQLAARVRAFVDLAAAYLSPVPANLCENPDCRRPLVDEGAVASADARADARVDASASARANGRKLVLINNIPRRYCAECVAAIPQAVEEARQEYRQQPSRLGLGLAAGLGIALLGAVVWVLVAVLLDRIAAIISAGIIYFILKAMQKMDVKMGAPAYILATLLTFFSVTLGQAATVGWVLMGMGYPLSPELVLVAFLALFEEPGLLFQSYFFTLLGGGAVLWSHISTQKRTEQRVYAPTVEVL